MSREIEIDGYNSDQNSHSYWLNSTTRSPLGRTDTPCSKPAQVKRQIVMPGIVPAPEDKRSADADCCKVSLKFPAGSQLSSKLLALRFLCAVWNCMVCLKLLI